ncbi:MAG: carbohydrate ABC transporter permease [Eubacteriales bacterium]|nr:carbohydrate ABC transporter permease [Eubacteriales bacterium]
MRNTNGIVKGFVGILLGLMIVFPVLYALSISLMPDSFIASYPPKLIPTQPTLENYVKAFHTAPVLRFVLNSAIVSICIMLAQVLTSALAAYAFVYFEFRGKRLIFIAILATMMIPGEAIIISNYLTVASAHLLDSYAGLILPYCASALGVFLMRQQFLTVPKEFKEAATIDGCGELWFFSSVLMPVSMPAASALAIYCFINTWNQYMWPLLITNSTDMRTVQIGISMLSFDDGMSYGLIMAGFIIILIPSVVIFVAGQKQMVGGLMAGSVKG